MTGVQTCALPILPQALEIINTVIAPHIPCDGIAVLEQQFGQRCGPAAAAVEFGKRNAQIFKKRIDSPSDIVPYIEHYGFKPNEHFITLALSGAREILSRQVVAVGGNNSATIRPREIFFEATKSHASAIIIAHNHPSGICRPSNLDVETTNHIHAVGELLGITLLDHIILTKDEYFSFSEHGMLN